MAQRTFSIGEKFALNYGDGNHNNDNFEIRGFVDGLIVILFDKKGYQIVSESLINMQIREGDLKQIL